MVSAEGGSVPNAVGYREGCPLSSRLGGLGSGAYFEGHRTLFFVPI